MVFVPFVPSSSFIGDDPYLGPYGPITGRAQQEWHSQVSTRSMIETGTVWYSPAHIRRPPSLIVLHCLCCHRGWLLPLLPPWLIVAFVAAALIVAFVAAVVDCCLCRHRGWLLPLLPPQLIVAFVAAAVDCCFCCRRVDCCLCCLRGWLLPESCKRVWNPCQIPTPLQVDFSIILRHSNCTLAVAGWLFSRFLPGSSVGHYHFCFRTNVMPPLQLQCLQRMHAEAAWRCGRSTSTPPGPKKRDRRYATPHAFFAAIMAKLFF